MLSEKNIEEILYKCFRGSGYRLTEGRRAILRHVLMESTHFDAELLYSKLRASGSEASRATVYRTLPILRSCGVLKETRRTQKGVEYEVVYHRPHHDHMRCLNCGKIIEFYSPEIEKLQDRICRNFGFKQTDHRLTITGYCKNCENRSTGKRLKHSKRDKA